jgi:hypothetical protein
MSKNHLLLRERHASREELAACAEAATVRAGVISGAFRNLADGIVAEYTDFADLMDRGRREETARVPDTIPSHVSAALGLTPDKILGSVDAASRPDLSPELSEAWPGPEGTNNDAYLRTLEHEASMPSRTVEAPTPTISSDNNPEMAAQVRAELNAIRGVDSNV